MAMVARNRGIMREHQIVINLKREQFEEVQRLARLAGSKSVGAYLRERVLTFLALKGTDEDDQTIAPSAQELLEINHELTRMHRELQVFIAESLSTNSYNSDEDDEDELDDEVYYAHQNLQNAVERDLDDYRTQSYDTAYSAPSDPYPIIQPVKQPPPFPLHRMNSEPAPQPDYRQTTSPAETGPQKFLTLDPPVLIGPDATDSYGTGSGLGVGTRADSGTANGANLSSGQNTGAGAGAGFNPSGNASSGSALNPTSSSATPGSNAINAQRNQSVNLPDAITPGAWSGLAASSFLDSAGMYSTGTAESIWLTPPNQVLTPGYQNDGVKNEQPSTSMPADYQHSSGAPQANSPQPNITNSHNPYANPSNSGTAPGGTRKQLDQPNDELEDLAERAFAISPRLGALDKTSNAPIGFRKRQIEDPLDDLLDDTIMEEAEKLRMASIEEESPYDNSVVYAFTPGENEDAGPPQPTASAEDVKVSFPSEQESRDYTNDLAIQIQARLQAPLAGSPSDYAKTELSYTANSPTEESPTSADLTAPAKAPTDDLHAHTQPPDEHIPQPTASSYDLLAAQSQAFDTQSPSSADNPLQTQTTDDGESGPPPPTPSADDPPPPPAPRPDSSALSGPPPKRRRLPDDMTPDDDDRLSGGPPPKRRKR
jgi:hypothetical protein